MWYCSLQKYAACVAGCPAWRDVGEVEEGSVYQLRASGWYLGTLVGARFRVTGERKSICSCRERHLLGLRDFCPGEACFCLPAAASASLLDYPNYKSCNFIICIHFSLHAPVRCAKTHNCSDLSLCRALVPIQQAQLSKKGSTSVGHTAKTRDALLTARHSTASNLP